ncbi:MAG TPA: hypothetical protein VLH77_01105, partial [Gammaproteobacteria bacterium]|nr:hypothetical protein [Gammaproteobacteria bacterium]
MEWKTVENNSMRIDIKDASVQIDSIIGEEQVIPLQASGDPLHISITDNDENKFTPIRAKKATIKFLNSTEINFLTFASGEDDRFPVTITCDTNIIFLGFLQQGDIREPFLFQEAQEVVLTAVDGLAFLKNLLLVDYKGDPVSGVHTIIDYIAFSLLRTGLQLNINVFNNIREQNSPGRWKTIATFTAPHTWTVPLPGYTNINQLNFFKVGNVVSITGSASNNGIKVITSVIDTGGGTAQIVTSDTITNEASGPLINFEDVSDGGCWYSTCRLDAKTFEADIGVSEDCDTILRKILGHDSFIEQYLGEWYIFRVKELRNDFQQYRTLYDFSGAFQNFTSGYNLQQAIGLKDITGTPFPVAPDAVSFFSKEATTRTISRPNGNVKLIYNYVQPKELPCNVDFSNGGFIADLPDETIDGLVNQAKSYDLGCWTIERDFPSSGVDFNAYVKKLFYNGYEKQRFAVLEKPVSTAGGHFRFIRSESIPINIKDKFTWAFDYRAS